MSLAIHLYTNVQIENEYDWTELVIPGCEMTITANLTEIWNALCVEELLYGSTGSYASNLIPPLEDALGELLDEPEHYLQFQHPGGNGTYRMAADALIKLIAMCRKYPRAYYWSA